MAVLLLSVLAPMGQKAPGGQLRQSGRAPLRPASLRAEWRALLGNAQLCPERGIDDNSLKL